MTHFNIHPGRVRVDRFKESGKWYDTLEVDMTPYYDEPLIHRALRSAIEDAGWAENFVDGWLEQGGFFVCLDPYHIHSHPITIKGH